MQILNDLAVIPIVVNAGAALLPAILAGAASFAALLFKPKELMRACAAHPGRVVIVLAVVGVLTALVMFWPAPKAGVSSARRAVPAVDAATGSGMMNIDWTRVALARIAAGNQTPAAVQPAASVPSTGTAKAFVYRGGAERLGSMGGEIEGKLQLAWNYHPRWTDNGVETEDRDAMILASPAIHGDKIYAASCTLDPPESFGAIFCLDAATGEQVWTVDTADGEPFKGFFSSPAISADGRYLVIGQGLHPDSNCRLICIETATGKVHWTFQVPLHIESSPWIDGDMVHVGAGAIEDVKTKLPLGHPGFVFAVRLSDGKEAWRFDVNDPESSPVYHDGVLYIGSGFNGKAVVALKTPQQAGQKAEQLWKSDAPYPVTGAVTFTDEAVFAGGGNGDFVFRDPNPAGVVMALHPADGKLIWKADLPDAVLGAVAASKHLICPVANGQVMALSRSTGEKIWATAVNGSAPVLAAPAVTEKEVFAVSQNGYLARFNLETGEQTERIYINSEEKPGEQGLSISSPLVVGGRLIVGSETGGLRCYVGGGVK